MRVIHLLRKPLSAVSISANLLAHGCGGLCIDPCRIAAPEGGSPSAYRRASARKSGKVPTQKRLIGVATAAEAAEEGRYGYRGAPTLYMAERPSEQLGRWPANVILEHLPECEATGTRKVQSRGERKGGGLKFSGRTYAGDKHTLEMPRADFAGHGGEDGLETVMAWECPVGCPVRDLDSQSGISMGTGGDTSGHNAFGQDSGWNPHNNRATHIPRPNDIGGASRYFKQVGGRS